MGTLLAKVIGVMFSVAGGKGHSNLLRPQWSHHRGWSASVQESDTEVVETTLPLLQIR